MRGIPLILEKSPDVRFTQVAGIFITEFPRPIHAENTPSEASVTPQVTPPVAPPVAHAPPVAPQVMMLLQSINGECSREELQELLALSDREHFRKSYLIPALAATLIERTLPDKPNSRLQ